MDASALSKWVVLVTWTVPTWYTFLTLRKSRASNTKTGALTLLVLAWGVLMFNLIRSDWLDTLPNGRSAALLGGLVVAVAVTFIFRGWLVGEGLSQRWLVGLQVFRVIGALFLIELGRGQLPAVFAVPAGVGDVIVGVTAAAVLVHSLTSGQTSRFGVVFLAIIGIADFIGAFTFGFLSSAGPLQVFAFDAPNTVASYPLGLIPGYLVPFAFGFHVLSLTVLFRDRDTDRTTQRSNA